jgi:hypothetical protein
MIGKNTSQEAYASENGIKNKINGKIIKSLVFIFYASQFLFLIFNV